MTCGCKTFAQPQTSALETAMAQKAQERRIGRFFSGRGARDEEWRGLVGDGRWQESFWSAAE
jgi:hypothetical protein